MKILKNSTVWKLNKEDLHWNWCESRVIARAHAHIHTHTHAHIHAKIAHEVTHGLDVADGVESGHAIVGSSLIK